MPVREPLPVLRPGRGLLIAAVGLALVVASLGLLVGCGGKSTAQGSALVRASYPGYNLSFRYPSTWRRRNWCWIGNNLYPLTLLSTAVPPACHAITAYNQGTPLPPPQRIRPNGVAAWWLAANKAGSARFEPNTHVAGRPALVTVHRQPTRRTAHSYVNCDASGPTQRFLQALIRGPSSTVHEVQLGAVICGPNFAAGEADVRRMLDSLRFTR